MGDRPRRNPAAPEHIHRETLERRDFRRTHVQLEPNVHFGMEVGFLQRGREEQTWRALAESQEQAFGSLLRKGSIARSKRANPD